MAKKSCELYPEVNGKPSRMYRDLLKVKKLKRPLANYIYAVYLSQNLADAMDNAGFKRNAQGEHSANDVWKFLDVASWQNEVNSLTDTEEQEGFIDSNHQ